MASKPQSSVWNYSKPALCRKTMNSAKMSEPAVRTNVSSFVIVTFLIVNLRFTVHIIYHFGKIPSTVLVQVLNLRPHLDPKAAGGLAPWDSTWERCELIKRIMLRCWCDLLQCKPLCHVLMPIGHIQLFLHPQTGHCLSPVDVHALHLHHFWGWRCLCVCGRQQVACVCVDDFFTTCSLSTTRNSTACRSPLHPLCSWCGCDSSGCFHSSPAMAILRGACVIATCERIAAFGLYTSFYRNITAILFSFHFLIILLVRPIQEGPDKCTAQWTVRCWGSLGAWMALAWVILHRVLALFGAASPLAAATAGL